MVAAVRNRGAIILPLLLTALLLPQSAAALTAQDVLEKKESREAHTYLCASIEMAAFLAHAQGDTERSACILEWWFETPGTKDTVFSTFARLPDRTASAILYVLMKKACGEPTTAAR